MPEFSPDERSKIYRIVLRQVTVSAALAKTAIDLQYAISHLASDDKEGARAFTERAEGHLTEYFTAVDELLAAISDGLGPSDG